VPTDADGEDPQCPSPEVGRTFAASPVASALHESAEFEMSTGCRYEAGAGELLRLCAVFFGTSFCVAEVCDDEAIAATQVCWTCASPPWGGDNGADYSAAHFKHKVSYQMDRYDITRAMFGGLWRPHWRLSTLQGYSACPGRRRL